jgi:hypothetical protein
MLEKVPSASSKRIGGMERAEKAREALKLIFADESHPMYFSKDIEFARGFNVARHTIYKIRENLGVSPRSERLLKKLHALDLSQFTIKELSTLLNVKYQNLYKIILEHKFQVKPDTPPIVFLKTYQATHKGQRKKRPREESSSLKKEK